MPAKARAQPPNKFDHAEQHRSEIEARTAVGETCEQIAGALRAKGVDITNKTISRRRVEWGLRKRPFSRTMGNTRVQKSGPTRSRSLTSKKALKGARRAEIEARTQRGETAEQIADALSAQGFELKAGASSILRLQTTWGLIAHDHARARGLKRKSATDSTATTRRKPKESKREQERQANEMQQNHTLHYPTNCSFGPKKRINGVVPINDEDNDGVQMDADADDGDSLDQPSVSVATEIMSVEFLVDLANSTLAASTNLKEMLLAYQARRPVQGSNTGLPPALEDLTTARRKVREAAAVMHDLAAEPSEESGH